MLTNSLNLNWAFGFSKDVKNSTQSLCVKDRNALFLISSHSGVIYDFEHRTQTILQGHCNIISCCAVDRSKRWIVTADSGYDPIMVVWDAFTFVPVKTISIPHETGVESLDISDDSLFIATLSAVDYKRDQQLAIWAWTREDNDAILRRNVDSNGEHHTSVKFNPRNKSQVATNSQKSVCYWTWDEFNLESYLGKVSKTDLGNYSGHFVTTIFLPGTENALTATSDGYIIVWETQGSSTGKVENSNPTIKVATKVLRLVETGINLMTTTFNDYLVVACTDGAVRFYDYFLRLEAWFEDLAAGSITSISFSEQMCPYPRGEAGAPGLKFWVPDFIVGTADAFVVGVESSLFDEVRKDDRRGTLLMQGLSEEVVAVACHPTKPLVAIVCSNSVLQVWNYEMKLLMILREFNNTKVVSSIVQDNTNNGGNNNNTTRATTAANTKAIKNQLRARCLAFDSTGTMLAVGFTSGNIKLLNTENLEDIATFAPSNDSIEKLKFSPSGAYMAASDTSNHIILFSKDVPELDTSAQKDTDGIMAYYNSATPKVEQKLSYTYIGRALAHTSAITGFEFGIKDTVETLVSISEDRYCVEYNLQESTMLAGVQCVKTEYKNANNDDGSSYKVVAHRIELTANPTAIMWHPKVDDDVEDRFVVANDEFKFKEYNLDSKQCRKTTLAPRFGSPAIHLAHIPNVTITSPTKHHIQRDISTHYVFSTSSRVIGIGSFPLTGDPSKVIGIVAHPNELTSIAVSYDGQYLFSTGGSDLSCNMWKIDLNIPVITDNNNNDSTLKGGSSFEDTPFDLKINTNVPHSNNNAVYNDMVSFYSLLEGGENGELHHDLIDYFYYCQLRNLGEDSMDPRNLTGKIPLEEIPSLVRAVGFYPSEEEVTNMINEVRYKRFMITGETQDEIGFEEVVKLYINHRPVVPLDKQLITAAFEKICVNLGTYDINELTWDKLRYCLTQEGEKISNEDLEAYFLALTGADTQSLSNESKFEPKTFAEQILGFEDFGVL